jgi:organic radical activating enzyme
MTCSKFNNPEGLDTTDHSVLMFNPVDYKDIYSIPVISRGCDSQYSWNRDFAHMWITGDEHKLAAEIVSKLPNSTWVHPITKQPVIFSITGGEPMLHSKKLPVLLNHPQMMGCKILLIETNGSVPIHANLLSFLHDWLDEDPTRSVIFSNSPKLSSSGERAARAIKPSVIISQEILYDTFPAQVQQYFKFVCGSVADVDEIDQVMSTYAEHHVLVPDVGVYLMPMACTADQQTTIAPIIADLCISRGYTFCIRLQNVLWSNSVGT